MDTVSLIGAVLELQVIAVQLSLFLLTMLLVLRLLLRSLWLAAGGFVLVNTAFFCLAVSRSPQSRPASASVLPLRLRVWILVRFGLLAGVVGYGVLASPSRFP